MSMVENPYPLGGDFAEAWGEGAAAERERVVKLLRAEGAARAGGTAADYWADFIERSAPSPSPPDTPTEEWRVLGDDGQVLRVASVNREWAEGQARGLAARFPEESFRIERRDKGGEWEAADCPADTPMGSCDPRCGDPRCEAASAPSPSEPDAIGLLRQIKAIMDEALCERTGDGPWRVEQYARIEALLRDWPETRRDPRLNRIGGHGSPGPQFPASAASPSPPGPPTPCPACGGSGDRNGNLRASDPFGTCPGCDGTGVQDRDAAHQFPTQHGFAVTVARALESAAEAVRRERLRIVDLIGSEFPDSMPLLAGDVIGMLQADFLDRAERSEHDDRD